mmetsp:Transcript_93338/g.291048  ORF Transcript_93338/g.291048 Transcript_93338/m.291048 type:complete len:201 (+) Transcript_93338:312-914(+)
MPDLRRQQPHAARGQPGPGLRGPLRRRGGLLHGGARALRRRGRGARGRHRPLLPRQRGGGRYLPTPKKLQRGRTSASARRRLAAGAAAGAEYGQNPPWHFRLHGCHRPCQYLDRGAASAAALRSDAKARRHPDGRGAAVGADSGRPAVARRVAHGPSPAADVTAGPPGRRLHAADCVRAERLDGCHPGGCPEVRRGPELC